MKKLIINEELLSGNEYWKVLFSIDEASERYGVNPNLIRAIIKKESNFDPNSRSPLGAIGLMQLMPDTAKELGVYDIHNSYDNIMGGTKYIANELDRFNGDVEKALAAYHAGSGNVIKYGGIPPFKETQNYVKDIIEMVEQVS